ncbi:TPA: recombinase RecA, partial [Patescibacteria group bacterium]|nr:recombinase RecA [Patescibacteria group bacterium]
QAEFDLMFAGGVSREGELLDLAVSKNIIAKAGAWYEFEGNKIGQGKEAVKEFLKADKKTADKLEKMIRAAI